MSSGNGKRAHLADVVLLGSETSNPAIPGENLQGKIFAGPEGLIFEPSPRGFVAELLWGEHKTILIPWDNFQRCGWDIGYIGGLDGVVTGLFEPFTLGLFTPDYAYTWVNYWDEYYGTNFVLSFRIGPHYLRNRAIQLARDILAAHGKYRRQVRSAHTIVRRG